MILACHNLNKAFGEQIIVKDGSFHIEEHEKAALIGLNGAGKSTILKMIMGELPLDSGEVILAKRENNRLSFPTSEIRKWEYHLRGSKDG